MKKIICAVLVALISLSCILANAENGVTKEEQMFANAKQALILMAEKEYASALKLLELEKILTEKELTGRIEKNCSALVGMEPQTQYAVYWTIKENGYLAVPFEDPTDGFVMSVVYVLNDSLEFTDIVFAEWADIAESYEASDNVIWNIEYAPEYIVIID